VLSSFTQLRFRKNWFRNMFQCDKPRRNKSEWASVSKEWSTTSVTFSSHSRSTQLSSSRKKFLAHAKSQFHINAEKILESAQNNSLPNAIDQLHESEYLGTSKLFRSAYFLAKKDRPFSDHFDMLSLQDLNCVDWFALPLFSGCCN